MDYEPLNELLRFSETVSSVSVNVTLINDILVEDTEMFLARIAVLTSGTDIVFFPGDTAPVSIIDDDSKLFYLTSSADWQ